MRTTLTLDDDVAAALRRRQAERGTGLKQEVNELLRSALHAPDAEPAEREPYRVPTFSLGRPLVTDPREWKQMLDDEDVERYLRTLR